MIEGRATARYVRTSAQKAKLVLDLIRGYGVDNALATLRFTRKGVARDVAKVLRSAVSNAQHKEGASGDTDRLYVGECYANQGPSLKRIRAAPMGRAFRITKRTSHLTVTVLERPEVTAAVPAPVAAEGETEKATPVRGKASATGSGGRTVKKRTSASKKAGGRRRAPSKKRAPTKS